MPGTSPGQHSPRPDGGEDVSARDDHDLESDADASNDEGADPTDDIRQQNPGETTTGDLADRD